MTASNALGAEQAPDQQVTPAVRTQMADPAAWAVTAFATTSFMLGMYRTGILNAAGTRSCFPPPSSSAALCRSSWPSWPGITPPGMS